MKTKILSAVSLLLFCAIGLSSCLNTEDEAPMVKVETVRLHIAAETGTYQPWGTDKPLPCMLIREEGESESQPLGLNSIRGFKYEEGYAYLLLVEKSTPRFPPQDDSGISYKLIEVLSQTKTE